MDAGFFTNCQTLLDKSIKSFIQSISDSLTTELQPVLLTALTIYFMCKAWSIMYSNSEGSMKQLTTQCIKMAFVVALFCNAPNFYNYIADPVYELDKPFVEIVSKPFSYKPKDCFDALDGLYINLIDKTSSASAKIFEAALKPTKVSVGIGSLEIPNIPAFTEGIILVICMAILILCTVFAVFTAFVILITNTIGLCFILAFGPLFGAFLLFPQTKHLFDSWLKQCLNFMLTKIFVVAAITLMGQMITNLFGFEGATDKVTMPGIASLFSPKKTYEEYIGGQFSAIFETGLAFIFGGAFVLTFGLFIAKLPHIATSLTGGAEMNGGPATQAINNSAIRHGMNALTAPQNAIGKAAAAAAVNQEAKGHKWRAGALRWMNREFTPKPKESSGPSKS